MTKQGQNITDYYSGDTLRISSTVNDDGGNAVNITGCSMTYSIINTNGTPLLTKTVAGGGITLTDASTGQYRIDIDPGDTDSLEGTYDHECEMTLSGNVSTLFVGSIEILADKVV